MSAPLIAHVIHRLAVGGLENGVVNLINHLPSDRFRHAIVCLTEATDFAGRIRRADVPIVELHKRPGNSLSIHRRFHRVFRDMRPDVVHTRNLGALEAQLAAAVAGVPVRIHGEHGWDTADPDGSNRKLAMIRRVYSPLVHRYVALSAHLERYLIERVGISADRVERICNGVDCELFQPRTSARTDFAHPPFRDPSTVVVGTVGRLEPVKDQLALARAFAAAIERAPDARRYLRLAIVGSGSLRPAIEHVVETARISDLVWLAGERPDVSHLLPQFDVFVLPSQAEGISNTILEAMASGLPVIATAVGGNVELVSDGTTGMLVPPGNIDALCDAILRVGQSSALRGKLGAAARERALEQFSLQEMVRRYAAMYDRELNRRLARAVGGAARTRATAE